MNTLQIQKRSQWVLNLFPFLMLLLAGLGLGLTIFLGRTDLTIFSLVLIVPLVLAAGVLLVNRDRRIGQLPEYVSRPGFFGLTLINDLILIASVASLATSTTRPLAYFVLVALYSGVLLIQIISVRPKWSDSIIVLQIILLSLNLIWGVTLKYPLYFGDTDLLVHLNLIDTIVKTGHVASYNPDYLHYPLYHIFTALGVEITGGSLQVVLFVFMGLAWQAGIIFAFLIFRDLSGSSRFASIAGLLFALSSQTIFYGSYSIPRSLAFVFFIAWIYLILKAQKDRRYLFLSLIALTAMIITHHLNVLYVIPVLALVYACQVFVNKFRRDRPLDPLFVYLLAIGSVSYLIWVASNMADTIPGTIRTMLSEGGIKSGFSLTHGFGFSVILGTLYYSFALFLSLLGIRSFFDYLSRRRRLAGSFVLTGIAALVIYVPGFMYLFPFSDVLLTDRMILIVSPFVAFLMAYGVEYLCQARVIPGIRLGGNSYAMLLPVILIATSFFSVISIGNAKDTNYFPHTAMVDSPYFTRAELASFSFLNNSGDKTMPVYSDYAASRNDYMLAGFPSREIIRGGNLLDIRGGYIILRTAELQRRQSLGFFSETGDTKIGEFEYTIRYPIDQLNTELDALTSSASGNKIYSDEDVQIYVMKEGP